VARLTVFWKKKQLPLTRDFNKDLSPKYAKARTKDFNWPSSPGSQGLSLQGQQQWPQFCP